MTAPVPHEKEIAAISCPGRLGVRFYIAAALCRSKNSPGANNGALKFEITRTGGGKK